ncbi:MAG: hypothetical protein ACOC58_04460 [Chloroflexota bacterium]
MARRQPIAPSEAYYIKLGRGGRYEQQCIEVDQTVRLDYRSVPHELCIEADWEAVLEELKPLSGSLGAATRHLNQVRHFYEADETVLWVTFYCGRLYWCFSKPDVELLDDNTKIRPVLGEWRSTDIQGKPLVKSRLSGRLLSVQGFHGAICSVKDFNYLSQRINGQIPKDVEEARTALSELERKLTALIRRLYWRDFEILIDLVFRQAGWQRVSELGMRLKTLDLDLISPITAERYGAQVKSKANLVEFKDYQEKFTDMQGYTRLYFVVHSPTGDLRKAETVENVELWLPEDIARWVVKYGLAEWVLDKTS